MNFRSTFRDRLLNAESTKIQKFFRAALKMQAWIILALAVLVALYYFLRPLPDTLDQEARLAALEKQKSALTLQRDKISRRITWIKDKSTGYLEMMARDHLDWQKDGEVIVQIRR
jgi:cell division protein FtsB